VLHESDPRALADQTERGEVISTPRTGDFLGVSKAGGRTRLYASRRLPPAERVAFFLPAGPHLERRRAGRERSRRHHLGLRTASRCRTRVVSTYRLDVYDR